jgi:hypothetical protein
VNERIRQLARQAAAIEGWGPEVWQTTFSEKFAELIVRECVERIQTVGVLEHMASTGDMFADAVMEHFGVES